MTPAEMQELRTLAEEARDTEAASKAPAATEAAYDAACDEAVYAATTLGYRHVAILALLDAAAERDRLWSLLLKARVLLGDAESEFYDAAHTSGDPDDAANMDGASVLYRETKALIAQIEASIGSAAS